MPNPRTPRPGEVRPAGRRLCGAGSGDGPRNDFRRGCGTEVWRSDAGVHRTAGLVELIRDGERITPRSHEPRDDCFKPLEPKTFVVAIDRAPVRPAFELHPPAEPGFRVDEQLLARRALS